MTPDGEFTVTPAQVAALLRDQAPQYAALSLRPAMSSGTDHTMIRLGDELCLRLPRRPWAVDTVRKEYTWLPMIAPHLPVATPEPLLLGEPGHGYPFPWTVCRWVPGVQPRAEALALPVALAVDLARFIATLHRVDPMDGPPTVWSRPLHEENHRFRHVLDDVLRRLPIAVDRPALVAAWQVAIRARPAGSLCWVHGDLAPGNLVLRGPGEDFAARQGGEGGARRSAVDQALQVSGEDFASRRGDKGAPRKGPADQAWESDRLHGVLDFSMLGLGDPAADLRPAWNLLPPTGRDVLRRDLAVDDDTWARGRGWVLLQALMQLHYYLGSNQNLVANAILVLTRVADEFGPGCSTGATG